RLVVTTHCSAPLSPLVGGTGRVGEASSFLAEGASEGLTKTDVFRRALALYLLVKEREEGGSTLQFVKDDQRETLVSI
ncbi:MAG: hypothetical protein NTU65_00395, partial [Cyanobacteria bacterium]|nr:hypothetical protein [Cyanobacteriota bacterium]